MNNFNPWARVTCLTGSDRSTVVETSFQKLNDLIVRAQTRVIMDSEKPKQRQYAQIVLET